MRQYKLFSFFIQVILFIQISFSGFERTSQPTSAFARAFSGTAMYDADNVWMNPASLSKISSFQSSLFYFPSPFQLKQLSNYGMITTQHFDRFNIGIGLNSFGFSLYRESSGSITAGTMLTESFGAGVSFHLYHLSVANYGTSLAAVFDVGAVYSITEQLNIGFALNNVTGASFGADDDIPQTLLTGISYHVVENATLNIDLVKDIRYETTYRASVEFSPHEIVIVRAGTQGEPSRLFGGIGINVAPFQIEYGVATHSELGLTHSIGITFSN